ncbi:MAG: hypothetical protein AB7P21_28430 [Lautropia sp.]
MPTPGAFDAVSQVRQLSGRLRLKYLDADHVSRFHNLTLVGSGYLRSQPVLMSDCAQFGKRTFELGRIQACLDLETRKLIPDVAAWLASRSPARTTTNAGARAPRAASRAHATLQ